MEHKTFNLARKQHIRVNTLVNDKTASDQQLTDSSKHPTSLCNIRDRMKKTKEPMMLQELNLVTINIRIYKLSNRFTYIKHLRIFIRKY